MLLLLTAAAYCCCFCLLLLLAASALLLLLLLMPRCNSFALQAADSPSYSGYILARYSLSCVLGLLGLLHTMAIAYAQKRPDDFSLAASR